MILWALLGAISLFGSVALLRQNDPRVNPLAFIYVAYAFHEDDHDLSPPSLARSMQSLFLWSLIAFLCGVLGVRRFGICMQGARSICSCEGLSLYEDAGTFCKVTCPQHMRATISL